MSDDVLEDHWDACGSTAAHTHPPLILSPSTLGPSSEHNTSRPESLPTNKIISNILLMSQNYIKSLKVDEYDWQTIYFRGSIGREPKHLAPVWHKPREDNARSYKMSFKRTSIGLKPCKHATTSYAWYTASRLACILFIIFFQMSDPWLRKIIYGLYAATIIGTIVHQCPSEHKEQNCTNAAEGEIMWDLRTIRNMLNIMLWSRA